MAEANFTIGLDDESKELIQKLIDAIDRLNDKPDPDKSFSDPGKRLIEPYPLPDYYRPYWPPTFPQVWGTTTTNTANLAEDGYIDEEDA